MTSKALYKRGCRIFRLRRRWGKTNFESPLWRDFKFKHPIIAQSVLITYDPSEAVSLH